MYIEISETHEKDDKIHEKCPEPDRTRMYPHPIESDSEPIETDGDEKHPRSRIRDERSDRLYEGRMSFFHREEIRPSDREHDTEESPEIHSLTEEKYARKYRCNGDESLHRGDKWYISEGEGLEIEILSEIVKKSSPGNNPDKRWELDMARYSFSDEERNRDNDDRERTNPRHHSCIEGLQRLFGRNILESIQEWEDKECVEINQEEIWLYLPRDIECTK